MFKHLKKLSVLILILTILLLVLASCVIEPSYTITFESNGGSKVAAITKKAGEAITAPAAPTKTGYAFEGWFTDDETFEDAYTFDKMPEESFTLYAKWTINQYTISFSSNGGSNVTAITKDYGTEVDEPAEPTKEGYTFSGWFVDNETFENEYVFSIITAQDISLHAKWVPNKYPVSFFIWDETEEEYIEEANIEVPYGQQIIIPELLREGYSINNWYTDQEKTLEWNFNNPMPGGTVILYGNWTINQYTISFNSNSGSEVTAITKEAGVSITAPTAPTRTGYTFGGWYTDNNTFINKYEFTTMPEESFTLYAKWIYAQPSGSSALRELYEENIDLFIEVWGDGFGATQEDIYFVDTEDQFLDEVKEVFEVNSIEAIIMIDGMPLAIQFSGAEEDFLMEIEESSDLQMLSDIYGYTIDENIIFFGIYSARYIFTGNAEINQDETAYIGQDGTVLIRYIGSDSAYSIGDGITNIGFGAFAMCEDLTSVSIPNSVKSIGAVAFMGCASLSSIIIPNTVTTIGAMPFMECTSLTIYAEASSKPNGWADMWNPDNRPVFWGYTGQDVTYSFVTNGGTVVNDIISVFIDEAPITTKDGYTLLGWYDNADCLGNAVEFPYYSSSATTLYAEWGQEVTYSFVTNGGTVVDDIIAVFIDEAPITTKDGYTLLGWYDNADCLGNAVEFPYYSSSATTLYAEWGQEVTYSFVTNGGTVVDDIIAVFIDEAPITTKDGYTLLGWYDNADCLGSAVDFPYYSSSATTLYAEWSQVSSFDTAITIVLNDIYDVSILQLEEQKYYKFVATESDDYVIQSYGDIDTVVELYDAQQNYIDSNDDGGNNLNFKLTCSLSEGQTYFIVVRLWSGTGNFSFDVQKKQAMGGDSFTNAPLVQLDTTYELDYMDYPNGIYYAFEPIQTGSYQLLFLSSLGTLYDSTETILTEKNHTLIVDLTQGETYFIYLQQDYDPSAEFIITEYTETELDYLWAAKENLFNEIFGDVELEEDMGKLEDNIMILTGNFFGEDINTKSVMYFGELPLLIECSENDIDSLQNELNVMYDIYMHFTKVTGKNILVSDFFSLDYIINDDITSENNVYYNNDETVLIRYNDTATSFVVPNGITQIGFGAFAMCEDLTSVSIPNSVKSIGAVAFMGCASLSSIIIPNTVTTIGAMPFMECTSLTIYAEASSKPNGWADMWNPDNRPVFWGYTGQDVTYSFVTNGGTVVNDIISVFIDEAPITTKDGYTLLGWYDNADCLGNAVEFPYYSSSATTLYAEWGQEVTYSFVTNGGTVVDDIIAVFIDQAPITTKDGYTFVGWYDNADCLGSAVDFPYYSSSATTLYAEWSQVSSFDTAITIVLNDIYDVSILQLEEQKYYKFVATESDDYVIQSYGDIDTVVELYDAQQNYIDSNDDGGNNLNFKLTSSLSEGQTYFIVVRLWSGTGNFSFDVQKKQAMGGDSFTNAISVQQDTTYQINYMDYPDGIYYVFEPMQTGSYYLLFGSSVGTLYDSTETILTEKNCALIVDLTQGETYYIYLQSLYSSSGEFIISEYTETELDYLWADKQNLFNEIWGDVELEEDIGKVEDNIMILTGNFFGEDINTKSVMYFGELPLLIECSENDIDSLQNELNVMYDIYMHFTKVTGKNILVSDFFSLDYIINDDITSENNVYYNNDETVLIRYNDTATSFVVPNGITQIGFGAFAGRVDIDSITLQSGITSICYGAFADCSSLTSITIPSSVTSIGDGAFSGCTSLTSITIPDSVTSIGDGAFSGCTSLTSITIPDSVTSIGDDAFSYCSSLTSITIPDSVTSIGNGAFSYCSSLTSITIPDSVTSIGAWAFEGCTSLTSITISDSVTSIGDYAFYYCSSLTSITIPDSVTSIGNGAFSYCSSLTSITIPDSVTSIGDDAFSYCSSLTSITIPDSVTSIGDGAFEDCTSLTSITIPDSVTSIGAWAFYGCSSLTIHAEASSKLDGWADMWNPDNRPVVWGYAGQAIDFDSNGGSNVQAITKEAGVSITAPTAPTKAGYTFGGWYTDNNTFINEYEFTTMPEESFTLYAKWIYAQPSGSSALRELYEENIDLFIEVWGDGFGATQEDIYFVDTEDQFLDEVKEVFEVNSIEAIIMIDGMPLAIQFSGAEEDFLMEIEESSDLQMLSDIYGYTIDENIIFFGIFSARYIFTGNAEINQDETAYIGQDGTVLIRYIGSDSAYSIGDGITNIGFGAFIMRDGLISITIPNTVTSIGVGAFSYCYSLTSITIPDSVTSIGDGAFSGCSSLTSIEVSVDNINYKSIEGVLFNKAGTELIQYPIGNSKTSYDIPISVTSIGDDAFSYCSSLTSITIPDSVTSIGAWAFYDCTSLTSITIPDSVTSIGDYAFSHCSSLTSIAIPDSVTSIGDRAFSHCTGLTSIEVSVDNINYKSIEGVLFNKAGTELIQYPIGNSKTSYDIPISVTSIGDDAFSYCSSLTSITIPDSVTSIGDYAFSHCTSLTSITIPDSVTSIGDDAFSYCSSLTSITIPDSVTSIGAWAFYDCTSLTIYAEASSKLDGWADMWNPDNRPVVWGYAGQ